MRSAAESPRLALAHARPSGTHATQHCCRRACHLVTGGTGGLGLLTARWLAQRGARARSRSPRAAARWRAARRPPSGRRCVRAARRRWCSGATRARRRTCGGSWRGRALRGLRACGTRRACSRTGCCLGRRRRARRACTRPRRTAAWALQHATARLRAARVRALLVGGGAARRRWAGQLLRGQRVPRRARRGAPARARAGGDERAVGRVGGGGHGGARRGERADGGDGGGVGVWSHRAGAGPRGAGRGGAAGGADAAGRGARAVAAHAAAVHSAVCPPSCRHGARAARAEVRAGRSGGESSVASAWRISLEAVLEMVQAHGGRRRRRGRAADGGGRRLARRGRAAQPAAARRRRRRRALEHADVRPPDGAAAGAPPAGQPAGGGAARQRTEEGSGARIGGSIERCEALAERGAAMGVSAGGALREMSHCGATCCA